MSYPGSDQLRLWCQACGNVEIVMDPSDYDETGDILCEECEENTVRCFSCDERIPVEESFPHVSGARLCEHCHD